MSRYFGPVGRMCNGNIIFSDGPVDSEGSSLMVGDLVVFNRSGTLCRGNITKITKKKTVRNSWSSNMWYNVHIAIGNDQTAVVKNTDGIYKLRTYDH